MNFVKHSTVAHECLRARPEARPHHISLYWALFFAWNAARFPAELPLDRATIMRVARIGNRNTYLDALRDLAAWRLLTYLPSHAGGSSVRLQPLDVVIPEVSQPAPVTCTSSATTAVAEVEPEVLQPPPQNCYNPAPEVVAEVNQPSLIDKTCTAANGVNGGSADKPKKKEGKVFTGEGLSEAQVLDDLTSPSEAPDDVTHAAHRAPTKTKGVGEHPPNSRDPRPRRPASLPELPFRQSPLYNLAAFTAAFVGTDYALADLPHYHQLIDNWRDKKTGLPPVRRDWAATARRFMLNDAHDNRLKLAPGHQPHQPGAGPAAPDPGARPAGSGYRSKYDA